MRIKYFLFIILYFLLNHSYAQKTDFNKGLKAFDTKDFKTVVEQLTPFAQKGRGTAQFEVGFAYLYDYDMKNDSLAVHWLLLAAEQKQVKAMGALADYYFRADKVKEHLIKSYLWGMLAATYDQAQEINTITLLAKAYMKPEELNRANSLINEYERKWFHKPNCQ